MAAGMSPESDLQERILAKITADLDTGCWNWQGSRITTRGELTYGRLTIGNKSVLAHRTSYEAFVGPIPKGKELDHLCRNQACVNPDHLEAVTARENQLRGTGVAARNKAKTHCKHGHEYTPENTYIMPSTKKSGQVWRLCVTCYPERRDKLVTVAEFMGRAA